MKIWSCFGVGLSQFCPGRLESWRYKWAKISKNLALHDESVEFLMV